MFHLSEPSPPRGDDDSNNLHADLCRISLPLSRAKVNGHAGTGSLAQCSLTDHLDEDSNPWIAAANGPRSSMGAAGFRSFSTSPKGPKSSKESTAAGGDEPPAGGNTNSKGPKSSP